MTEQKIREAFENYLSHKTEKHLYSYADFRAGYLALLNELEPQCHLVSFNAKLGGANNVPHRERMAA